MDQYNNYGRDDQAPPQSRQPAQDQRRDDGYGAYNQGHNQNQQYQPRQNNGYQQGQQGGGYPQNNQGYGNRGGYGGGGFQKKPYGGNGGGYGGGGGFQRKPKPDFGPIELYKPYAVIGNREAPLDVMTRITRIAQELNKNGYTCRIDASEGPSGAVEPLECRKELVLAWKGFNNKESQFTFSQPEAYEIAKLFHPTWDTLKQGVQAFLARNARIIMGKDLKSPILFLVCWSDDGAESAKERTSRTGFAGHCIAMASALGVPIFNLHKPDAEKRLYEYLRLAPSVNNPSTPQVQEHVQSYQAHQSHQPNQSHQPATYSYGDDNYHG